MGIDAGNRRVIEDAIELWMFETVACTLLRESQELLEGSDFAVVFCGESWGDGAYYDLLNATRRNRKAPPIVVLITNPIQDSVFQEAMAKGAFGVISSPCVRKDIQWMVIRATQNGPRARRPF